MPEIDKPIFGIHRPLRYKLVASPGPVDPEFDGEPTPVYIDGVARKGAAVANSTATDIAGVNAKINELLASLRAAGIIA